MSSIESVTTAALATALDVASLRHQAIAANISNAHTVGYVPQKVSFNEQWALAQRSVQERGAIEPSLLPGLGVQLLPVLNAQGEPAEVHLDAEVANMAANSVHYQALLKGLSRHMSLMMYAASDGKK